MPVTIDELLSLVRQGNSTGRNMQWQASENAVFLKIETGTYANHRGDHTLIGQIRLIGGGWGISIEAPSAFHVPQDARGPISEFCLRKQMEMPLIRFALDESDGELRPVVQQVLGDESLDQLRLSVLLMAMIGACEELGAVIQGTGPSLGED